MNKKNDRASPPSENKVSADRQNTRELFSGGSNKFLVIAIA